KSNLIPELAEKWEVPDETTYVFYLRKGVRFHDGSELTAADVKYTFETILNPEFKSPKRGSYEKIKTIEALDPYTVKFTLTETFAPFLTNMVLGIVPQHAAERMGKDFSQHPIGTGPYQFKTWSSDEKLEFSVFLEYFEGRAKIDQIVYKIVPDDTVRFLELRKGTLDFVQNAIPPDVIPLVRKTKELRILTEEGTNVAYLGFNLKDPILKEKKVRQAIAHALNRDSIIKYLLKGLAQPATGLLAPSNWAYEPDVTRYEYNKELAKKLLDAAGYPDSDGDGPESRFSLTYKTSENQLRKRIGEALQYQLKEVGIDVVLRSYEWGTFFSDITKGNFQTYTLEWVGITEPDIFHYIFHSSNIPPRGANRGQYVNPELDRLVEEGRKTLDLEKRKTIYSQVQKILAEDLPYVFLWHGTHVVVARDRVQGFIIYPAGDFTSLKRVEIRE
ncbi:MAG: ABC transporter substrate-binding protein, partial [Nitrospira sp.]|nr:ABC transporter substrate-binding protein [Nitrospira sp.]